MDRSAAWTTERSSGRTCELNHVPLSGSWNWPVNTRVHPWESRMSRKSDVELLKAIDAGDRDQIAEEKKMGYGSNSRVRLR